MSTHTMPLKCESCGNDDFSIILEYFNKETLIKEVEDTKCPECGSEKWYSTDECGR